MPKISVKIPLAGLSAGKSKVTVDATGYVGGACKAPTEKLAKALGSVEASQDKPEMFEANQQRLDINAGDGQIDW